MFDDVDWDWGGSRKMKGDRLGRGDAVREQIRRTVGCKISPAEDNTPGVTVLSCLEEPMEPLIMRDATPGARPEWRDIATDSDPLPAIVAIDAEGVTRETFSQVTKVDRETTDDK